MSIPRKNPFKFDVEVDGSYFCGREDAIDDVKDFIFNHTNMIMFSKRRIGKSSLIKEVFNNRLDNNILTSHVDIYAVSNIRELYEYLKEGIEDSLIGKETSLDKLSDLTKKLNDFFANANVKLTISDSPKIELASTEKDYYKSLKQLFDGYFSFLKDSNLHAVIAIDEFQKIISLNESEKIEALLRTIVNKRENCSFIFTGSKRNLLLSLFNKSDRPFFKLGVEYPLLPIDMTEFFEWTQARFKMKNIILNKDAFEYLFDISDGETRFIQLVSYKLFRTTEDATIITRDKMMKYVALIIKSKKDFGMYLDTFTTAQQNTLKVIAINEGANLFDEKVLLDYDIKSSSLQSALKSLMEKGVVFKSDKYIQFEDIEFKLWLRFL
ncbi:MAG: hypothetical protein COB42_08960 [Sulfurimonas sp.]|nr:MAG: hypothetical protein COB42_08960 [Sulfurimonas sp.]